MSYVSATLTEHKSLDLAASLLIAATVTYYIILSVFVVCSLPFLLLSVPIEYLLKDRPKTHGDAVVCIMVFSIASTILTLSILAYNYILCGNNYNIRMKF